MKKIFFIILVFVSLCSCEKASVVNSERADILTQKRMLFKGNGKGVDMFDCLEVYDPTQTEWIDLGLPSGKLWASCNIGANEPEDFGGYYAWGELKQKSSYSYSNYKFYAGETYKNRDYVIVYKMNKYTDFTRGWSTINPMLDAEDDICTSFFGAKAHIPTVIEFQELVDNTDITFETVGSSDVIRFSKGEQSIIMPLAGFCKDDRYYRGAVNPDCESWGPIGYYWLNSRKIDGEILPNEDEAYHTDIMQKMYEAFGSYGKKTLTTLLPYERFYGMTIRAVKSK